MNRESRVTSVSKRTSSALVTATLLIAAGAAVWMQSVQAQVGTPASAPLSAAPAAAPAPAIATVPGMPPVPDARNLYSETASGKWSPVVQGDLERIYVPNLRSNDVYVIDPAQMKVVDRFKVGYSPQHVVPSWDLRTLWVTNNAERRNDGSLTPIDPRTGKRGPDVVVDNPYNMYFSPDGKSAIVVAEARKRLDFRDPQTMAMQYSIDVPGCPGVNHADFSIDGRFAIFTCEFAGTLVKIDLAERKVLGYLKLQMPATRFKEVPGAPRLKPGQVWEPGGTEVCRVTRGMPQDIRSSPDGKRFYIADMHADGVHIVDGESFTQVGFIRHRPRRARPLSEPRRQAALRGQPRLAQDPRLQARQRRRRGDRLRHREGGRALGRTWRRQPRHGQHQPRRQVAVAGRALRRRGLPLRHRQRRGAQDQGRRRAARTDRVAAAGPLLARPHRQPALSLSPP